MNCKLLHYLRGDQLLPKAAGCLIHSLAVTGNIQCIDRAEQGIDQPDRIIVIAECLFTDLPIGQQSGILRLVEVMHKRFFGRPVTVRYIAQGFFMVSTRNK
ncbi:hypothetical protein D3C80_1802810 [compost metagenome]